MISINKCLILAVVASVLLSAAFVKADDSAEEATSEKPRVIGGFGTKIYNGIKNAGSAIMSHLKPYLSHPGAAEEIVSTPATAADEDAAPEAEGEAKSEEEETTGDAEEASAEEPAAEAASEEPATEAAAEEPSTEAAAEATTESS